MPLTITLVRHAQTPHNLERRIQTRSDIQLGNLGVIQANIVGERLCEERFTRVYSSNMKRAKSTAERILRNNRHQIPAEILVDDRISERDFGDWEGLSLDFVENESSRTGIRMHRLHAPNGEPYEEYAPKGLDFFHDICQLSKETLVNHNILVVTHCFWIMTLMDSLVKHPNKYHILHLKANETSWCDPPPGTTSVTRVKVEKYEADEEEALHAHPHNKLILSFECFADLSHLKLA